MTKEELADKYAEEQLNSCGDNFKNLLSTLLSDAYLKGYADGKEPIVNNPDDPQNASEIEPVYNNMDLPSGTLWSNYLDDKALGYGRHTHKFFLYNEIKNLQLPTKEQVLELFKYTKNNGGETGDLYKRWNYADFLSINGLTYSLVQDEYECGGDTLAEFWLKDSVEDDITMAYLAVIKNINDRDRSIQVSFEKTFKGDKHSVVVVKDI